MKKYLFLSLLFVLLITIGCSNNKENAENCINYIDSLRINLGDTTLRVAFIKPELKNMVRPYAFIYNKHLIVLNKADAFYTFSFDCLERDTIFEEQLNKMKFKRAFVLGTSLYGVDGNKVSYLYDESKKNWNKSEITLPFRNEIPVYEDEKYICYSVCHGEFGGAVFFYNKISHETTFFPANCLVCVMKKEKGGYYILSNLAHMRGGSSVIGINNPDSLFKFSDSLFVDNGWREMHWQKLSDLTRDDTAVFSKQISFDFRGDEKLISSGFFYGDNYYFLTQMAKYKTYLTKLRYDSTGAIIKNESILKLPNFRTIILRHDELDTIPVSDTVFYDLPASDGEITSKINGITIINYTYFANDPDDWSEYSYRNLLATTFIQRDSSLIRIDWPKLK